MNVIYNMYIEKMILECKRVSTNKEILDVGAGGCELDYHLLQNGFDVISTDYQRTEFFDNCMKEYEHLLDYHESNIYNLSSFPVNSKELVICTEVLEHLTEYKLAFSNLLQLTDKTLIVGVPYKHSFNHPGPPPEGHCNFWDLGENPKVYKNIYEFEQMCKPHDFHVEKILTKPEDAKTGQASLLMIINKRN